MTKDRMSLQVSADEMRYYRDNEHLTNKEIAERLGISYNTVIRYIGKQPTDFKQKARLKKVDIMPLKPVDYKQESPKDMAQELAKETTTETEPCLLMETTTLRLSGEKCTYIIHADTHAIDISVNGNENHITIGINEIDKVIRELSTIKKKQSVIANFKDMW